MSTNLHIGLSAVILSVQDDSPTFLGTQKSGKRPALPFGKFDPATDRTFELALRRWVAEQTGFPLRHVEQLYTFGDRNRTSEDGLMRDNADQVRLISVGYLALTPTPETVSAGFDAKWRSWYEHFPWEDHRSGTPGIISETLHPRLLTWAAGNSERLDRIRLAFGLDGQPWIEERVLERYELLYEAVLVSEARMDANLPTDKHDHGRPLLSDHRRILATAISRIRGKLKYRPVIFDLVDETFTLSGLQHAVEAILGLRLHKQNFRRALDRSDMLEKTGKMEAETGGRPAELYRFKRALLKSRSLMGISAPILKQQ